MTNEEIKTARVLLGKIGLNADCVLETDMERKVAWDALSRMLANDNNEERIKLLSEAELKGYDLLKTLSPTDIAYSHLLDNLSKTRLFIECLADNHSFKPLGRSIVEDDTEQHSTTPEQAETEAPIFEIIKMSDKTPDKTEPVEEKITELVTTEDPKPEPTYDKKEVLDLMKAARRKGVNVSEIIKSFGVDNFGDIDAEKYPAVVDALKAEGAV